MILTPGTAVLVRAHADIPRTSGTLLSLNRDGAAVIRRKCGATVTTYDRTAILPLVTR